MVLLVAGVVCELFGLGLAARGVTRTWAENATGEPLWARPLGTLREFVRHSLLRRPRDVRVVTASMNVTLSALAASVYGAVGFSPDASLEDKVGQLKREVEAAGLAAHTAQRQGDALKEALDKTAGSVRQELSTAVDSITEATRKQALSGIHETLGGLALASLGTVLQFVANAL